MTDRKKTDQEKPDQKKKIQKKIGPSGKIFIQPLAVGAVAAVLILLFLFIGFMNVNMLNRTMNGFTTYKADTMIKDVQELMEGVFQQLIRYRSPGYYEPAADTSGDNGISMQESFVMDLMTTAHDLAVREQQGLKRLVSLARQEGIRRVALLDEQGRIVHSYGTIPEDIIRDASLVAKGVEDYTIRLFDRLSQTEGIGFIAMRRVAGTGALVMALDPVDFDNRCLSFTVRNALKNINLDSDAAYVIITDADNYILTSSGSLAPQRMSLLKTSESNADMRPKNLLLDDHAILEIMRPFRIHDRVIGFMRSGIIADVSGRLILKHRRMVLISVFFMIMITVVSMIFLYYNHQRHLKDMRAMERSMSRMERLSSMARLAAGVAHEIRNPLNAISMGIQRLQKETGHALTRVIRDEITRLNGIIEDFIGISGNRLVLKKQDLGELLDQMLLLLDEEAGDAGIRIVRDWEDQPFMVEMDAGKMKQALLNIVKNGMDAVSGPGSVTVSVKAIHPDHVKVTVADTGCGLSDDEIAQIFDPDYTTKDKGLGLGLPIAREIIKGHGGGIFVQNNPDAGAVFEILLPA